MRDFWDRLAVVFLRALTAGLSKLPVSTTIRLGRAVGRLTFFFSGRRRVAYADLKAALGETYTARQRWQIVREHYAHLGETAVEILVFPRIDHAYIRQHTATYHEERLHEVLRAGKGLIFVTAHLGNWELSQIVVTEFFGKRIYVLARDQKYRRLNAFLNELRGSHGSVAASRGIGIRDLLRALRRNELIGMLVDQDAGKTGGLILPFFGRKTTIPTGAFELAHRTGAVILPCFMPRHQGTFHDFFICEPISVTEQNYEPQVRHFLAVLEDFIRRFPSQWLWGSKRWKYTWTKRVLVLSDGKPGHVKQSETLAAQFETIQTQYGRPGMEYLKSTLPVEFKSQFHKRIFPWFAFFFIPWAQGRLSWLRFFFTPETQKAIEASSADFIISAGASLIPLNLCLARESRAKSLVLMKPSFPFNFYRYDLALIPAHDRGIMPRGDSFRHRLALSRMAPAELEEAGEKFRQGLRDPARVKFSIFLGGPTRRFQMETAEVRKFFSVMEELAGAYGDFLVTTSRRTPEEISKFLKNEIAKNSSCQKVVIAAEDPRPEVAPGMMALADILIVTEDSISMISEAVSSGKRVVVLGFERNGLPVKHRRFKEILERDAAIVTARPATLKEKIEELEARMENDVAKDEDHLANKEETALRKRLQEIL